MGADVADDKGDSSQGVVAHLANDKEDVSQEVVADRDLPGGETADCAPEATSDSGQPMVAQTGTNDVVGRLVAPPEIGSPTTETQLGGSTTIEQPLPGQYDNIVGSSALPSPTPADIAPFLDDDEPDSEEDQPASVKAESDSMAEIFEPESHVQPISGEICTTGPSGSPPNREPNENGDVSEGVVAEVAADEGDSSQGVVADIPTDKEDVSEEVVAEVADDKGDSSQGVVADLSTDEEDVSQEVVSDCDLSGGETADLASDKGDVSEGVVADAADDKGNSSEGVQGVMPGLEGHKDGICQKR